MANPYNRVKVIYRVFEGEVIALFPEVPAAPQSGMCLSYAHVGQHGAADASGIVRASRPAKPEEYAELDAELRSIGYEPIIRHKITRGMWAAHVAANEEMR